MPLLKDCLFDIMTLAQPMAYIGGGTIHLGDQWQEACMKTIIIVEISFGELK